MFLHSKKMATAYLAAIFFVILDRLLKAGAIAGIKINLIGEILKFNFVKNYYIAFSLPISGWSLNAVIIIIILLLAYFLIKSWLQNDRLSSACLFAIILGALSNLFDRLKYGYVVDYFDLKYFTIFNLADAMIVAGVLFLLVVAYKKEAI